MPKLTIKTVSESKIAAEVRRRRAALIDMLVEELDLLGHEVKHEPNAKMRQKRAADDSLVEQIEVDGVPIELSVCAKTDDGALRNRLKLAFDYVHPDEKHLVYPQRAAEPKSGWDINKLAERIIERVDLGKQSYANFAREKAGEKLAEAIRQQFPNIESSFYLEVSRWQGKHDLGPFRLTLRGLCPQLVVLILEKLQEVADAEHCAEVCGLADEICAAEVPEEQMN